MPFTNLFWILFNILELLMFLILVDVIISWAIMFGARGISNYHPWVRALRSVTNPILAPFRRLWNVMLDALARSFRMRTFALRGFDLSPFLAIIAIQLVQALLLSAA